MTDTSKTTHTTTNTATKTHTHTRTHARTNNATQHIHRNRDTHGTRSEQVGQCTTKGLSEQREYTNGIEEEIECILRWNT